VKTTQEYIDAQILPRYARETVDQCVSQLANQEVDLALALLESIDYEIKQEIEKTFM